MSTGITLPELKVSAVGPVFTSSSLGASASMPSPGAFLASMHPKRLGKYAEGYWREMMVMHMEGGEQGHPKRMALHSNCGTFI